MNHIYMTETKTRMRQSLTTVAAAVMAVLHPAAEAWTAVVYRMDDTCVDVMCLRHTLPTATLGAKQWYHTCVVSLASLVATRCAIITANATCTTPTVAAMATAGAAETCTTHVVVFIVN